jgi:hypothetical protein
MSKAKGNKGQGRRSKGHTRGNKGETRLGAIGAGLWTRTKPGILESWKDYEMARREYLEALADGFDAQPDVFE